MFLKDTVEFKDLANCKDKALEISPTIVFASTAVF